MFKTLIQPMVRFLKREDGVTAVECALMLALVVMICLVVIVPPVKPSASYEPIVVTNTDAE